jgi:NAD(P) transhydrogenase subunit alpha
MPITSATAAASIEVLARRAVFAVVVVFPVLHEDADHFVPLLLEQPGARCHGRIDAAGQADDDARQRRACTRHGRCARLVTAFALEAAPRTTRAQSMDVLSSQANMAGYKAVMIGRRQVPAHLMPMLMTAAGTVKAARVVILGVGVAGLQAIATAKRLGAVIEASLTCARPSRSRSSRWAPSSSTSLYETAEEKEAAEGVGRLRPPDAAVLARPPEGGSRQARGRRRHGDHHRADPRSRRARADHRGHGQGP